MKDEMEVESFPRETEKSAIPGPVEETSKPSSSSKPKKEKERSKKRTPPPRTPSPKRKDLKVVEEDSDSDYEVTKEKEKRAELEKKKKAIQDEINSIKKQYHKDKSDKKKEKTEEEQKPPTQEDETIKDYLEEKEKYKKKALPAKGASREAFTLSLLAKFKNKLHSALESTSDNPPPAASEEDDENWLSHKLDFSESHEAVLAKDAATKQDDWYEIYDPRHPLNKRKRGEEKSSKGGEPSRKRHA
jgi:peptidyl-prolyl cis-trans isomerase SDCCAG10